MSNILNQQQQDLQLQLQELIKVGVGGKFKDNGLVTPTSNVFFKIYDIYLYNLFFFKQ